MTKKLMFVSLLVISALMQNLALVAGQESVTLLAVADNYVDSKYPQLGHYGKTPILYVGNSYDRSQDIWGSERIYIRFSLAELPKDHVILRATLRLWQFYAPKANQTYETHRVLGEWNETTQNWDSQPPWDPVKRSQAIAPSWKEVAVEWDITSDAQAWYEGEAPNFGTMIKVAEEKRLQEASSGFRSREAYPVGTHDDEKPRLVVVFQAKPEIAYVVTVNVAGLPDALVTTITVDGEFFGLVSSVGDERIVFDQRTAHIIAVSNSVSGPPGTRYTCRANETWVSAEIALTFSYSVEYFVTFATQPAGLFGTPSTGWYGEKASLSVTRTSPDVVYGAPGARLVFDAWYLNGQKLATDPSEIVVVGPTTVEVRYVTEFYLNVTSPFGKTEGSGWYSKDSTVSFSVDMDSARVAGVIGLLGVKRTFVRWIGSTNFVGLPIEPQGLVAMREPTTVEAVWQDDWSPLVLNVVLLLGVVALCVIVFRKRRSLGVRQRGQSRTASFRCCTIRGLCTPGN